MRPTKTLNIDADLHAELKILAAQEKTPLAIYAEAVLRAGLNRPKDVKRLLATRTNQEQQQAQPE